jgi:DNA repair exonuclease SbcCD ATPase subunit
MKITLTNFRCYKNEITFEFQDEGAILISGASGIGKSTILMAVNFALYDAGGRNIVSYGEKKCRVEFVFKDLKIVRTRGPSHLVVNDVYEDEVGQQIINDIFGKNFNVTGYISQNTTDSFLKKAAPAKREFLESVKFEHEHLSEKKQQLETLLKTYSQQLDKTTAKLETARSLLGPKPPEVPIPLKKKKTNDWEKSIKNETTHLANAVLHVKQKQKRISKKESELNDLRIVKTLVKSKDENISQVCSLLENLTLEMQQNDDYIGDDELLSYQQKLQHLKNNSQLVRLISQRDADEIKIKNMKDTEVAELQQNVTMIQSKLWIDYSKEDALSVIETNQDVLKDVAKVKQLRDKKVVLKDVAALEKKKEDVLDALENTKIELQRLDVLTCPKCDAEVLLENGTLIECDATLTKQEKDAGVKNKSLLTKQIGSLSNDLKQIDFQILQYHESSKKNDVLDLQIENILSQYEEELNETELKDDLTQMQSYYKAQIALESKLRDYQDKIDNEYFSSSYQSFKKELAKVNSQIQTLQGALSSDDDDTEGGDDEDEETIRNVITTNQQKKTRLEQLKKQLSSQNNLKTKLVNEVETSKNQFLEKYTTMTDEEVILADIEELRMKLKDDEREQEEHSHNLKLIDDYLLYKKQEDVHNQHVAEIQRLEREEQIDSNKYTQAKLFKQGLYEAEHIALANTVKDINAIANVYLQEFFDDPIFVNLSCFKEDKKKNEKPQINIDVKYKDMTCNNLDSLSGGEYARVNLAFTLSLAEIFKTPLLMLDETMSSLDEDVADIVFLSIKKHFKNIPVISILHQVQSEGDFDQVVKL